MQAQAQPAEKMSLRNENKSRTKEKKKKNQINFYLLSRLDDAHDLVAEIGAARRRAGPVGPPVDRAHVMQPDLAHRAEIIADATSGYHQSNVNRM
jgi:hypothetical protein